MKMITAQPSKQRPLLFLPYLHKLLYYQRRILFLFCLAVLGFASLPIIVFAQTSAVVPIIGKNFTGSTYKFNAGYPPPDSMGAVGPSHFVEFINGRYAVYDKTTTTLVQTSTLDEFWLATLPFGTQLANPYGAGFPSSAAFDPRLLYDNRSHRWFAIADNAMELLVAVSNSADPTQGWRGYQIDQHAEQDFVAPTGGQGQPTLDELISDLNHANNGLPCQSGAPCRLMQALGAGIHFGQNDLANPCRPRPPDLANPAPTQTLQFHTIERDLRWAVLSSVPGGYCNENTRLLRVENVNGVRQLVVYNWNDGRNIDFPTLGMDADNLYVTTQFFGNPFFVIPKTALTSGASPTLQACPATHPLCGTGVTVFRNAATTSTQASTDTQPVVDLDGNGLIPPLAVRGFLSMIEFFQVTDAGLTRIATLNAASSPPFSSRSGPPNVASQPGSDRNAASSQGLATNSFTSLSSNVILRSGELHGVQTVGVTVNGRLRARLRYFRVAVQYNAEAHTPFNVRVLDDQLLPAPAGLPDADMFYGSVAVNEHRQVVIGFSASSSSEFAGSYATAGDLDTSTQQMRFGRAIVLQPGYNEYQLGWGGFIDPRRGRNAWGDYSATVVDPVDSSRFWTIQEWASALDIWSTQITEIVLAPTTTAPRTVRVSATASGKHQPVTTFNFRNVEVGDTLGADCTGIPVPIKPTDPPDRCPTLVNKGLAIQNGKFIISPNLQIGSVYDASSLSLGDGQNEVTTWSFNFAEDSGYVNFFSVDSTGKVKVPTGALQYAELELTLIVKGDCANDTITLGSLGTIKLYNIFPVVKTAVGCAAGSVLAGTVNLLSIENPLTGRPYTSVEIVNAIAGTPWSLTATYRSNAIIVRARLSLGIPDLLVAGHGPAFDPPFGSFQSAILQYDGKAGAFDQYFSGTCHAVDMRYGPDGRLYILETGPTRFGITCEPRVAVRRVNGETGGEDIEDPNSGFVGFVPGGGRTLDFGPDGNLYISNGTGVLRFQGPFRASAGEPVGDGQFITGLLDVTKLRFGPDGALYVADQRTNAVLRYQGPYHNDPGALIDIFVESGPEPGRGLISPSDLLFGPDGNLYVASSVNGLVLRYEGPFSSVPKRPLGVFAQLGFSPHAIAFGPDDDLFVSGTPLFADGVFRYSGTDGSFKGQFVHVQGDVIGPAGPLLFSSIPLAPAVPLGDFVNNDQCVGQSDLNDLVTAIKSRSKDLKYDLNGDRQVNIADARKLVLLFTNPQGAACP